MPLGYGWAAWFRLRCRAALTLPLPVPAVLQFLVDHVERMAEDGTLIHDLPPAIDHTLVENGFKGELGAPALNTVLHRLSVLSKAHQMRDATNPTRDPAVQELVRRIRRAYATRGVRPGSKTALTKDPLEALLATCTNGLIGIRDRALLLFAFSSGGRRRSEVAGAIMENLVKVDDQTYLYRLTHSKTDQAGTARNTDADKPLVGPAAEALTCWLTTSGVRSGAIFRRIRKTKAVEPLSAQAVGHIVQHKKGYPADWATTIPIWPLEAIDELPRIARISPVALPICGESNEKPTALATSKVASAVLSATHPGRKSSPTVLLVKQIPPSHAKSRRPVMETPLLLKRSEQSFHKMPQCSNTIPWKASASTSSIAPSLDGIRCTGNPLSAAERPARSAAVQ